MDREPIGDKLPMIGRARPLDVEFMELFADVAANLSAIRTALDAAAASPETFAENYKAASASIAEREEAVKKRFERILNYLINGELRG